MALTVLLLPVVLLAAAVSASVAATAVHAAVVRAGAWAWLGDAAVVSDVFAGLALLGVPAAVRRERLVRSGIAEVDEMAGDEFEARLASLYADLGYTVTRTGSRGDFGADLLLDRDGDRTVVQAKRYRGAVGIEAVQQVIGATRYYGGARPLVVTNSTFTSAAAELARAHDAELVERTELVRLLAAHPLPTSGSSAPVVLSREIAGGVALVWFATGRLLRLVWLVLRAPLRLPIALRRARR